MFAIQIGLLALINLLPPAAEPEQTEDSELTAAPA